jgi:hypothetical protein
MCGCTAFKAAVTARLEAAISQMWSPFMAAGRNRSTDAVVVVGLSEAALGEVIQITIAPGKCGGIPVAVMVHQVNHATQHRSEVAVMLTQFGHSPGDLDFLDYVDIANSKEYGCSPQRRFANGSLRSLAGRLGLCAICCNRFRLMTCAPIGMVAQAGRWKCWVICAILMIFVQRLRLTTEQEQATLASQPRSVGRRTAV